MPAAHNPPPDLLSGNDPPLRQRTPPRFGHGRSRSQRPLERVRLTIGTILAPHGVRGEFKVRLQTDDPEHLLTIKRLYLGDETTRARSSGRGCMPATR